MRLNASAKIPNPLSLAPQKKGTVGRPKCLRDGIRRQHEVPGDRDIKQGLAREPLE
jgi:hypothetical protein